MDRKADRMELVMRDIELIKEICSADVACPFTEHSLLTKCETENNHIPDEYYFNDRLPVVFTSVAKDVYKDFGQLLIDRMESNQSFHESANLSLSSDDDDDDGDDDDNEEEEHCSVDDERDEVLLNSSEAFEENQMNVHLMSDVEAVKNQYTPGTVVTRTYTGIGDVDVDLHIPIDGIDDIVANAWSLVPDKPLIVSLTLSLSDYFNTNEVPVNVYQINDNNDKEKSGIHIQMEKIISRFVKETSTIAYNQYTSSCYSPHTSSGEHADSMAPPHKKSSCSNNALEIKKAVPTLEHGYLVQIMLYAQLRLRTLNEFCVICDEAHVLESESMLKPAVCCRGLCVFAFQTLGVMANTAKEIAKGMANAVKEIAKGNEVVDLLIAMANAACQSERCALILEPYPTVVDPNSTDQLAFDPEKKDFTKVQKTIGTILQMSHFLNEPPDLLKMNLDNSDPLAFPMLQWIISSNRSHIVKLPSNKQLSFMNTPHQFLLRSSAPEKELAFVEARTKYGSTFAFHGSNIENWHSIVRRGLLNASNTKLQLHGTAHGSGIYLSPSSSVSFRYSSGGCGQIAYSVRVRKRRTLGLSNNNDKKNNNDNREGTSEQVANNGSKADLLQNKNITCVALCEVISSPSLKKCEKIWVMPEPDHVCTRFFFVYENTEQLNVQYVDTEDKDVLAKIVKAMQDIYS